MHKEESKPIVKVRKLVQIGGSYYISVPPEFIKTHGLQKGDWLPVLANHIMKVVPMKEG